jgi:GH25 family lysozyme M1 (1,4-beta-N-acetylmuramidase)
MNNAHGIDISKWQEFYIPKPNPPRPVDFVIQRLSYGYRRDERLAQLAPAVLDGQISGAYHYASSAVDWKTQADFFLQLADGKYDFLAWDVEKGYNTNSTSFIYGVLYALEYLTKEAGKRVLLYVNPDTWATWLQPIQRDLMAFPLWVSHYWTIRADPAKDPRPNYWTVRGAANMPRDWRIWQYDDKGGGSRGKDYGAGSFGLDLNLYNGTVDEMKAWLNVPPDPKLDRIACPYCGEELPANYTVS